MRTKLLKMAKWLIDQFIDLFRHIYEIREKDKTIGYVGMDGSFIPKEEDVKRGGMK